ncbi:hypothetical protein HDU76_001321 [Blyttiomyces sp. JEL0837]|nr:hypothetical protein HDU76_001321 [Blyttiomyces sp. JEL0837]
MCLHAQKIKLVSEISQSGRAAIASSRTRQLVKPNLNSHSNFYSNIINLSPPNKTSVNISDPQYGLNYPGFKLYYTKVPVTIGQSGNFSLVLTASLSITTFVRGANCNSGPSCEGPKLKSADQDITSSLDAFGIAFAYQSASGTGVTTAAFTIGDAHPQYFEFCSFETAVNFTTSDFGDGLFSLTNNANFELPFTRKLSWLISSFPSDQQIAGLYLPFVDRPNDHGELTLGGYDSSRFEGSITYFKHGFPLNILSWGLYANDVSCAIKGTNATFNASSINPQGVKVYVEPLYDAVSMNDDCFALVTETLNAVQDPKTGFLFVDCGLLKTGPDVRLAFGGHVFTLVPESCE